MWYEFITGLGMGVSTFFTQTWAAMTNGQRAERPMVYDIVDASFRVAEVARNYTGDPLKGALDYSEHPARIEFFKLQNSLKSLNIDCDDVQVYAYWLLFDKPWIEWIRMVNVYDFGLPNFSHAVVQLKVKDGPMMIIDTNIVDDKGGYRGPYVGNKSPREYCQDMYGSLGANYLYERARDWPFEPIQ